MEDFGQTFAEMIPEWSKDKLTTLDRKQEKYTYVSDQTIKRENRLGRSLKDIQSSLPPTNLAKLLGVSDVK